MNNTYSYSRRHTISGPATFACTLMACVACWIVSYLNSVGYPVYGEVTAPPLWNAHCQVLPGKAFTYAIGMLLMFGGAFLLHRANYVLVLIREKTLLPFLFYVLFISTNPDFLPLKSTSVGVFCLILAIYQLFTSYHDPGAKSKAYNASLLIGIGSLLWVHILWFIPLFWIGMYNFRSLSIRTFLASLLGVGTVYWFLLGWCIWFRDFTPFTIPFATLFKIRILGRCRHRVARLGRHHRHRHTDGCICYQHHHARIRRCATHTPVPVLPDLHVGMGLCALFPVRTGIGRVSGDSLYPLCHTDRPFLHRHAG